MIGDLYEILDVTQDAEPEDIKKAFKKAAHTHHPDKGGDPEVFHMIIIANTVLRDKEKRNRYDKGESWETILKSESDNSEVLQALAGLFISIIQQVDVNHNDVIQLMIHNIVQKQNANNQQITAINHKISKLEKVKERCVRQSGEGPNIFSAYIDSQIGSEQKTVLNLRSAVVAGDTMLEILKDYKYNFDPQVVPASGGTSGIIFTLG